MARTSTATDAPTNIPIMKLIIAASWKLG